MFDSLHFLHPEFLYAIIPLAIILWWVAWDQANANAWEKVIAPELLSFLLQGNGRNKANLAKWLVAIAWLVSVIALADPVWEKVPRPIFQTNTARVIVLDLSNSMLIDDLKPSRLARARFKVEDILSANGEGQVALVVFAGDAFTASPLARDVDTIRSLLQVLQPQIMPAQGSRADLGLLKAQALLKQANVSHGQILLIADGVSDENSVRAAAKAVKAAGHTLSVLGVGTEVGGQLRFRDRREVTVTLDETILKEISDIGGGEYRQISSNDSDLNAVVMQKMGEEGQQQVASEEMKGEDWKSTGPFLIFLLLPLAALAFRKGWLLQIALTTSLVSMLASPQPVMAATWQESINGQWEKLWYNKEQRADIAFQNKQYGDAIALTEDDLKRGSAAYKNGDYQAALDNFKRLDSVDARYNEGNTHAQMGKYKEAIEAYDAALESVPDMQDAIENKKIVEALLKQQQEEQKGDGEGEPSEDQEPGEEGDQESDENADSKEGESGEESDNEKSEQNKSDEENSDENQFKDANEERDEAGEEQDDTEAQNKEQEQEEGESEQAAPDQTEEAEAGDMPSEEVAAESLSEEEKMAAEQWLRRIPDDPGGLLRRKFLGQYQKRNWNRESTENPW